MKKVFLSLLAIGALTHGAAAQSTNAVNKISVGADLAIPTGDLSLISSLGYGGSINGEFNVAGSLNLTGSVGYLSFAYKKDIKEFFEQSGAKLDNQAGIPVKAGGKYYFGKFFYGAAELGASFSTGEDSATAFVYAPSVGVSYPLANKNAIDLGVRYESWSNEGTSSFIGVRAAYSFGL
jgi:hypothetical protein